MSTPNNRPPPTGQAKHVDFAKFQADQAAKRQATFGDNPGGKYEPQAWQLRMKYFTPTDATTRIRIIPHSPAAAFFKYHETWATVGAKKVNIIGNSHNGEKPVPDLAYYYAIEDGNEDLLTKNKYAITVVVLENYHAIKKQSQKDKAKSYTVYERCWGKDRLGRVRCDECKKGTEIVFGQQYYWSMGAMTRNQLTDLLGGLQYRCVSCHRGTLMAMSFACPLCKKVITDMGTEEVTSDDLAALREAEISCPHCEQFVTAVETSQCVVVHGSGDTATYDEGCSAPLAGPAVDNIYGYDFELRSTKINTSYVLEIDKFWPITKVAVPESMLRPMPLHKFLSHMALKEQSDKLMKPNVYGDDGEKAVAAYFLTEEKNIKEQAAEDAAAKPEDENAHSVDWSK